VQLHQLAGVVFVYADTLLILPGSLHLFDTLVQLGIV